MFNRIDLTKKHCQRMRLVSHPALAGDLADRALGTSHSHVHPEGGGADRFALYGTVYKRSHKKHMVRAEVETIGDQYHVQFTYELRDVVPPPKDYKSAAALAEMLEGHAEEVEIECTGTFIYRKADGWESAFPVPFVLPTPRPSRFPYTHLESVTFGRRVEDTLESSVGIRVAKDGDVIHTVSIKLSERFTSRIPMKALVGMTKISREFVHQAEVPQ